MSQMRRTNRRSETPQRSLQDAVPHGDPSISISTNIDDILDGGRLSRVSRARRSQRPPESRRGLSGEAGNLSVQPVRLYEEGEISTECHVDSLFSGEE